MLQTNVYNVEILFLMVGDYCFGQNLYAIFWYVLRYLFYFFYRF